MQTFFITLLVISFLALIVSVYKLGVAHGEARAYDEQLAELKARRDALEKDLNERA